MRTTSGMKMWVTGMAAISLLLALSLHGRADSRKEKDAASSTNAADTNAAAAVTNIPAYVEITDEDVYLPVEDAGLTFDVGRQVFLFQLNSDSFIVLVPFGDEGKYRLCAFPRVSGRDQGTGWVTNEKLLFFGVRTRSMESRFVFDAGERLPVLSEADGIRVVQVERYGRTLEVELPDDFRGTAYIPAPEPVVVAAPVQPKPAVKPKPPPELAMSDEEPEDAMSSTPQLTEAAPADDTLMLSEAGTDNAGAVEPIDSGSLVPSTSESQNWRQRTTAMIAHNLWLLELLLALVILAAIPIIIKRNRASLVSGPALAEPPQAPGAFAAAVAASASAPVLTSHSPPMNMEFDDDEAVTAVETQINKKSNDEFTGSLETFTMGDLIQFIHSTTKTGALEIQSDESTAQNCLIFELGEIIDAVAGDKRGEDAVYAICRIRKGNYNFSRETRSGVNKTVDKSTMTLLLDAHRIMDEENSKPPEPEPAKAEAKAGKAAPAPRKKRQKLTMK